MQNSKPDYSLLSDTIFKRKSIRRYSMTPLDESTLADITATWEQLPSLSADASMEARLVTREQVKTGLQSAAPHYWAAFAEKTEANLLNIGFVGQLLSLYLTTRGLGSCWQGIPKPGEDLRQSSEQAFAAFLAFGKSEDSIYRQAITEFSRKPLGTITDTSALHDWLEPVRLAPSAVNNQPWFFSGDKKLIHVYCQKQNMIKGFLVKKYNLIDIGIALAHLWLAIKRSGQAETFYTEPVLAPKERSGYYYITSLRVA